MGTNSPPKISTPPAERVPSSSSTSSRHFSDRTFQSAPISKESKQAISYEFMSDVQAATIDLGLAGKDLLVQAKTGTGKTIAFLLPAIERLAKSGQPLHGISILVLAPTRELALQIEQEAVLLLKHHTKMTVGHVIGGINHRRSLDTILKKPPTILVATPGRLHDHLTDPEAADNVRTQFSRLQSLVYDEADRLLDQGFKKELDGILSALPDRQVSPRQVMLFSATLSKEIQEIARKSMRNDHEFVSTLAEDEVNTHEHVPQNSIITPFSNIFPTALRILRQDRLLHASPDATPSQLSSTPAHGLNPQNAKPLSKSKVIVFFPTARQASIAYDLLCALPGLPPVYEMHSRNSQPSRMRASANFTKAKEAILVCSDVAARGMDFPGVTFVVQVGLPSSAEQYIHRLGRTARAGESGRGIIILDPSEELFLSSKDMRSLPIHPATSSPTDTDLTSEQTEIAHALSQSVTPESKAQAYRAWLGYYKTHLKTIKWDREELVRRANAYVRETLGWDDEDVPSIEARTVGKMQLRGVPGLNIVKQQVSGSGAQRYGEQDPKWT
ncbi:hypothetical protein C0995_005273 [Termitomyces sp. Mi166|nr:hypothetical protein C0995_005273 [Termitomyces sp. Mi166\